MVVVDHAVKHRVFDGALDLAYHRAARNTEGLHDLGTVDRRLEVADVVTLVEVYHLAAHKREIVENPAHFFLILGGDVGLAESHQIFNVIARVVDQTAHSRIRDLVLHQCYGAHVELYEFGHIFHLGVLREPHAAENARHHLGTDEIVVVEGPAYFFVPALGDGLGYVMHKRSPAQPHVVALLGHVVEHGHSVVEIVLVAAAVDHVHPLHGGQFREDDGEQA